MNRHRGLYNHESPRRGENFVTRKITQSVARIKAGQQKELYLGNLASARDWGYAKEYVAGMWMMLQQEKPDDYVLATGVQHTIQDFLEASFNHVGLDWKEFVKLDKRFLRPTEVNILVGDPAKAKSLLGWEAKTDMAKLAALMTDADIEAL